MTTPHIRDYQGRRIHMIGIGGSSMSGLAQMLRARGYRLTGSDNLETYATKALREQGIPVTIGHSAENVHGAELVVYTIAILPDNPERVEAERLRLPTIERATLLGQMMEGAKTAIGVCGTHGKTSTTSMIAQALVQAGVDPSVHIGGSLDFIGGSTRIGGGEVFLTEACEFNASFLHLRPTVAVITNIEEDHLDFYKDIDDIQQAFGRFLALLPRDGYAIGNGDDERVLELMNGLACHRLTYGMRADCDFRPANLCYDAEGRGSFDVSRHGKNLGHISLKVAGFFHVYNALAAAACAYAQGADLGKAFAALSDFIGAHRRFELTGEIEGVKLYHDYGHNPAEMKSAVGVAAMQGRRVIAVMQPHTYSRVKGLFDDFLTCTRQAAITLVTDIFAAREADPGDIHSRMLVEGMQRAGIEAYLTPTFEDTEHWLLRHGREGDLVLTMGCGNINLLNDLMQKHWDDKQSALEGES